MGFTDKAYDSISMTTNLESVTLIYFTKRQSDLWLIQKHGFDPDVLL